MFEKLKKFFRFGLYTKAQIRVFVDKGVITEEQYLVIVGQSTFLDPDRLHSVTNE